MAFVYRAERSMQTTATDKVGPGTYVGHSEYQIQPGKAPFNTKGSRSPERRNEGNPGPGSYNASSFVFEGQKVVLQSGNSEVKVLELPKQSSNFISQTKRFNHQQTESSPGPGTYFKDEHLRDNNVFQQASSNIVSQIMKINRYQSFPSIPTQQQIYGYTEKNNQLEINKPPYHTYTGLKNDSVGPGEYKMKDQFQEKVQRGIEWARSNTAKLAPMVSKDQIENVGPGNYDLDPNLYPVYQMKKSSYGFASKTQRIFDQRRGNISQKVVISQIKKQNPQYLGKALDDDTSEEEEYIDDTTPGPGHYQQDHYSISTAASINQRSFSESRFKPQPSKTQRFQQHKETDLVGPGQYEISTSMIRPALYIKHPPFLSSDTKFQVPKIEKKPGPQHYQQKHNTLESQLVVNLHKAPIGNFGSNIERFEEPGQKEEVPGPGHYVVGKNATKKEKTQASFKSKTIRNAFKTGKDQFPPPGQYDVDNFNIEKAVRVEKEEDPDLAIKKPPFNVAEERFKPDPPKKPLDEDDEDELPKNGRSINDLFVRKPVHDAAFNTKASRFPNKQADHSPGPGEYFDSQKNIWKEKSFNILFAEI